MKKLSKQFVIAAAIVGCVATAQAVPTSATLFIWDNLGNTRTISDSSIIAGNVDVNGADGVVTWVGSIGNWLLNVDTGFSKPLIGSPTSPEMDLNFAQLSSTGAGTLHIAFWDNGFGPTGPATASASVGGTFGKAGSSLNYDTYTGGAAPTFIAGNLDLTGFSLLTSQSFSGAPGSFSGDIGGGLISGGATPFSLLQIITVRHSQAGQTTGDALLTSVPDGGATLMFLAFSLTAMGFIRRSVGSLRKA